MLGHPLDLLDGPLGAVADGDEGDAGAALGAVGAQVDEEAVVGPGPGERKVGVVDLAGRQPGAERR